MKIPQPHLEVWSKGPAQPSPVLLGSGPPKYMEPLFFVEARSPDREVVLVEHETAGELDKNQGFGEVLQHTAFILARNNYQPISIREEMFYGNFCDSVVNGAGETNENHEAKANEDGAWECFW